MSEVGAFDAKTNLGKLLTRVSKGERIVITRHGVPVAMLQPVNPARKMPPQQVISELKTFRRKHRLAGLALSEMIAEGRE